MKKNLNDVKNGKRNFGIFLILLQIIALRGSMLEGNKIPFDNIFQLIGFFIPGIIGTILIINNYRKNNDK